MGLLYPGALAFFALIPVLVLAYLAKERPSRVTVSSVLAFRALRGFRRERFGGWPRLDWMFFAEVLILSLVVLALAGPFIWKRTAPLAVVIDNSAAMQALTPSGQTRFDMAREKLDAELSAEDGGGEISVYVTAPQPRRVAPPFTTLTEARLALSQVKPTDAPNDQTTLENFLSNLASEARVAKVIFAGANALAAPVPARIHPIAVGDAVANAAIGSFSLRREVLGAEALHASLTIANFSPETRKLELVVTGDGKEVAHAKEALGARQTATLEFPAIPPARIYEAKLAPDDALALDNVAYATAGSVKSLSILFISPTPADAAGLNSIPGVAVTAKNPDSYSPDELGSYDLAIFEYATPKEIPGVNTMLVMPPPGDPVFGLTVTPTAKVQIAGWRTTDTLTDSVNFRLLSLRSGEYFGTHPWMSQVVGGDGGALMLKGERGAHRFVATGFNPFPYLGRRNLPMSVLTLNAISYLAGLGGSSSGYRTGQPWLVPAGVERVILPSGKKKTAHPGTLFTDVSEQGVYELVGPGGAKTPRAVNLADLTESDLSSSPLLKVEAANSGSAVEPLMEKSSLSDYLLLAIIALTALEALIVYRRRRVAEVAPVIPAGLPHDLTFAHHEVLYLLAIPAIVLLWGLVNARELRRVFAPLMRAIVLALFIVALANPQQVMHSEGAARPAIVDASASITPAMRAWTLKLLRDDLKLRPGDPAYVFAGDAAPQSIGAVESAFANGTGCAECDPRATNLESALYRIAADPDAHGGPAVMVTDGWQNRGDAERAISAIVNAEIRLDIFTPPGARSIPNVAMTALSLPPALEKAAPFALGVTMENLNDTPVTGTIAIERDGALIDERKVTLARGSQRFDFPVRTETVGLASYSATYKADNPAFDAYLEDDSLKGWVGVGARRKVLILTDSAKDANYLGTVVNRMGLEPTVVPITGGTTKWNGTVAGYDAVLINNVPSERIAPAAQNAMAAYVSRGGSLAMVGGDSSFGLGGYADSPLAPVMPVTMKPPQHKERKRALVLIIDKSGSMGRNDKLTYAKAAAETVTRSLKDNDLIGVIGFDSQPFVVIPLQSVGQSRAYFNQMVNRLSAHGQTFLIPALREAERTLGNSGTQVKHVVILTDGETGGTPEMYYDLVSRMHHDGGATISTIAVGQEANVDLLQAIAKYGGGSYYQTDSPSNLPQLFVEDFKAHGGDITMVEKEFTPRNESPDAILKDLAARQMPPLLGYVSTEIKPRATMDMYVDRSGTREPVIASWTYGAGKVMAVTTDASGRWSGTWVSANIFQPLWDRLLAWMTPEIPTEPKIDVALGYNAGRINIKLTDYSAEPGAAARLVTVLVTRPDGTRTETALTEEVVGELSGSIDAPAPGNYYFEVRSPAGKDKKFPPLAFTVSPSVNAELPRPEPNYGLLEQLASATGGRLNPSPAEVSTERATLERRVSMNPYLLVAAMILLIGEALVRRLTA